MAARLTLFTSTLTGFTGFMIVCALPPLEALLSGFVSVLLLLLFVWPAVTLADLARNSPFLL
jgi:hypothetical protein